MCMAESQRSGSGVLPGNQGEDLEALKRQELAGARVMAARNALRKGDRPGAKKLLKEAFGISQADQGALEMLGDLYLEEAETERAAELFERAVKLYPNNLAFEEKLAICHLDLAEMESDKIARQLLLEGNDPGKFEESKPSQAVTLSLFLPGAGQFYNDENEKGALYLTGAILSCLSWFYPLWTALSNLPPGSRIVDNMPNFGGAYASLGAGWSFVFWLGLLAWGAVYGLSMYDAGTTARARNEARRKVLGL